ncbi:hypothetical protein DQ04_14471000 [Trypanosoma grayi]|uniref:hypothetical protein n=1 Tax=Trypanosoma grayi TaxID=71804 RepID=UPI0004F4AE1F|nr:hypothetical protein DQ04_14471000 [Trypanosoma grayi]KEG06350.1 hypothetical protein DQ04_14471000 [Trypanosoma grayi]
MICPFSSLEVSLRYWWFHATTETSASCPSSVWFIARPLFCPLPLSIFSTFSNPPLPPQASQPCSSFHAMDVMTVLVGIATRLLK